MDKDAVTIAISSLALALSLVATLTAIRRDRHEARRAVKKEITDTLARIISTKLDAMKLFHDSAKQDPRYVQEISSILNQQNAFLFQQATFLMDQEPGLVTAIEYNTIATAMVDSGDLVTAERYYQKAIEVAPDAYYRSLAIRSYAVYMFAQRRFEEARDNFRKALTMVTGGGAATRFHLGITYQIWAWNELHNAGSPQRAEELFESAANEFRGIDNEMARANALQGLEAARMGLLQTGAPLVPKPAGVPASPGPRAFSIEQPPD